jgi:hypothetical protein
MVWIQDPSVTYASMNLSVREVPVGKVKNRLLGGKKKCRPWNCLELATHVEDGLRPTFLAGEDTRLLTKLKLDQATEYAGRRSYPQGYKEVEKWALLAEAGALTEPHQDSHGYSTYITANQGRIGFGWLSYPTDDERVQWTEDPEHSWRSVQVCCSGARTDSLLSSWHGALRLPSAVGRPYSCFRRSRVALLEYRTLG